MGGGNGAMGSRKVGEVRLDSRHCWLRDEPPRLSAPPLQFIPATPENQNSYHGLFGSLYLTEIAIPKILLEFYQPG
jgi:hypothetical protein